MAVQFLSFIRENRAGALLSGAAALCTYGAWMTRQDMMADPDAMMNSWLGINRFGLVFTKHLFGQTAFHPVLSRVLTVILLWITAMVLSFFVYKWSGGQKRKALRIYFGSCRRSIRRRRSELTGTMKNECSERLRFTISQEKP